MNIISQHKVIKVKGTVDKKPVEIFLDSCASVNLITSSALKKYNIITESIITIILLF